MPQACESNQYGEMPGRAARFGKPYLVNGHQQRQVAHIFKAPAKDLSNCTSNPLGSSHNRVFSNSACGVPGTSRNRAASSETIRTRDNGIPGTSNSSSATATTNDGHQEMKKIKWRFRGSSGLREKGGFRLRSRGMTLINGGRGQMSDPDDDHDSTTELSESEDDDAPAIGMGFGENTHVFMADGTTKRIKKIQPGEYVLGPDRLPRLVIGISAGRSSMMQVRELTQNHSHWPDKHFGLVTFTCTPKQALRLATKW
ncbi:H(+)-transporting V1 sector ATPase subunit A [Dissophora globulifera]|nr:H(+)-transporting V1 sector ATPase subunit A [Dissophora globulifera]